MKWIGQHIWDFISRFRGDVYLENLSSSSETDILVVDASGKISTNSGAGGGGGDITGVTITTDSGGGSAASDTSGNADFSILGSNGVDVTNSGTTITAVAVPGEIDHNSLNNHVPAEHYNWAVDNSSTATIDPANIRIDVLDLSDSSNNVVKRIKMPLADTFDSGDLTINLSEVSAGLLSYTDEASSRAGAGDSDQFHISGGVGRMKINSFEPQDLSGLQNSGLLRLCSGYGMGTSLHSGSASLPNDATDRASGEVILNSGDMQNNGGGDSTAGITSVTTGNAVNAAGAGHCEVGGINIFSGGASATSGNGITQDVQVYVGQAVSVSGSTTQGALKLGRSYHDIYMYSDTIMSNTTNDANGIELQFSKTRGGSVAGAVNDVLGKVSFKGINDAGTPEAIDYADLTVKINSVVDTDESGKLSMAVATSNGTASSKRDAFSLTGHATDNTISVVLGYGATSVTNIKGTLSMGGTAAMTNAGLLSVGNQTGITGVGTISSGTWEGTDIGVAHGGTGVSTLASNAVLTGNGSSAITAEANVSISSDMITAKVGGLAGPTKLDHTYVDAISKAQGTIVHFGGTTSMTAGSIYYFSKISEDWELADADDAITGSTLLGIALGASSDTHGMLLNGVGMVATDPGDAGDTLYLSTTAGRVTTVAPSGTGDIVRVVGYCMHDTSALVYFNPSSSWVEIA